MRTGFTLGFLLLLSTALPAQEIASAADLDQDGLSDTLEDILLAQFVPRFAVDRNDCSEKPGEFVPLQLSPTVRAANGTIYGQAFRREGKANVVELHYYHLWPRDCGEMGHRLDAEHVSVLLKRAPESSPDDWKAVYWYAAAHEDTVCDASQIARAQTLDAENAGARIWVSAGKHASFLSETLCKHGCGGDRCQAMKDLEVEKIVNLGEAQTPMNGAVWMSSTEWPLSDKLRRTDFPESRTERVERLPSTDIAWANPEKRPAQAIILGGNGTLGGAVTGVRATNTALVVANTNTSAALSLANDRTGSSLAKSFLQTMKALQKTAQKTGAALGAH